MKDSLSQIFLRLLLSAFFIFISTDLVSQSCNAPTNLNTTNISNFSVTTNWTLDTNVHHYRVRYKEIGATSWLFKHGVTSGSQDIDGLTSSTSYIWQVRSFCSVGNTNSSGWCLLDTFVTANFPLDCNNTPNGTAYIDSCGNCVGGVTGSLPCIPFSPTVSVSLGSLECNDNVDLLFSIG